MMKGQADPTLFLQDMVLDWTANSGHVYGV
jgi:hypothetical protein